MNRTAAPTRPHGTDSTWVDSCRRRSRDRRPDQRDLDECRTRPRRRPRHETIKRMLSDCSRGLWCAPSNDSPGTTARERETVKCRLDRGAAVAYVRSVRRRCRRCRSMPATPRLSSTGSMQRFFRSAPQRRRSRRRSTASGAARCDVLTVVVADDGAVSVNIRARIAEPFFTTRRDRATTVWV